jgi:hypothetical protein
MTIQLCQNPVCSSISELVNKFDFAHCRVGCYVQIVGDELEISPYVTKEFLAAMAAQTTFYCGNTIATAHPALRSLRRLPKVAIKLGLNQQEIMSISNDIIKDIISKGLDGLKL